MFSCEFCKISNNFFSYRTHPVAAFKLVALSHNFNKTKCDSFCFHFLFKLELFPSIFPYLSFLYLTICIYWNSKFLPRRPTQRKVTKACNFIKKVTLAEVSSCQFCKIFKNTFFTEHFCATLAWHSWITGQQRKGKGNSNSSLPLSQASGTKKLAKRLFLRAHDCTASDWTETGNLLHFLSKFAPAKHLAIFYQQKFIQSVNFPLWFIREKSKKNLVFAFFGNINIFNKKYCIFKIFYLHYYIFNIFPLVSCQD